MKLSDFYSEIFLKLDDSSKLYCVTEGLKIEEIEKHVVRGKSVSLYCKGNKLINLIFKKK